MLILLSGPDSDFKTLVVACRPNSSEVDEMNAYLPRATFQSCPMCYVLLVTNFTTSSILQLQNYLLYRVSANITNIGWSRVDKAIAVMKRVEFFWPTMYA